MVNPPSRRRRARFLPRSSGRPRTHARRSRSSESRRPRRITPGSIADSARIPPRGRGLQDGRIYRPDYQMNRLHTQSPPSSPMRSQEHTSRLFSPQASEQAEPPTAPLERFCYCDQPVKEDCIRCNSHQFCVDHAGFFFAVVLVADGYMLSVQDMTFILALMTARMAPF